MKTAIIIGRFWREGLAFTLILLLILAHSPQNILAELLNFKLNESLPNNSRISSMKLSPDGEYVVYTVNRYFEDALDLYSVPAGGGTPQLLEESLHDRSAVTDFEITPDSQYVVYRGFKIGESANELYSAPIRGGTPQKLNGVMEPGREVRYFRIVPNSSRVVYLAQQDSASYELFLAPIAGGSTQKLNAPLEEGQRLDTYYRLSNNSNSLVYGVWGSSVSGFIKLYHVPFQDKKPIELVSVADDADNKIKGFEISPDNRYVVYGFGPFSSSDQEMYSVPMAGGASAKLNEDYEEGRSAGGLLLSPTGSYLIYFSDRLIWNRPDMYSVPTGGGKSVKLNTPLEGGEIRSARITPDGSRIIYLQATGIYDIFHLYSVPITGGEPVRLNSEELNNGILYYEMDPNGRFVVFPYQDSERAGFFKAAIDKTGSVPLFTLPDPNVSLYINNNYYRLSADGSQFAFRINENEASSNFNLYTVPTEGGDAQKRHSFPDQDRSVSSFAISPTGAIVVYSADQETDDVIEIFVSIDEEAIEEPIIYLPFITH